MKQLRLEMNRQPDEVTCGPTCLHAVYRYFGDDQSLEEVIASVPQIETGGTLAGLLGVHALRKGYRATIHTYNLKVFDPTWFEPGGPPLAERLRARLERRDKPRFKVAIPAYLEFLDLGGEILFEDLGLDLLRRYLGRGLPILTGLSATYLYRGPRENPKTHEDDPVAGDPVGHFVVLSGYDAAASKVIVADPWHEVPGAKGRQSAIDIERVLGAILLGVLTYDGNLLVIEPADREQ